MSTPAISSVNVQSCKFSPSPPATSCCAGNMELYHLRSATISRDQFRVGLKTHLLKCAYTTLTFENYWRVNLLTYLLKYLENKGCSNNHIGLTFQKVYTDSFHANVQRNVVMLVLWQWSAFSCELQSTTGCRQAGTAGCRRLRIVYGLGGGCVMLTAVAEGRVIQRSSSLHVLHRVPRTQSLSLSCTQRITATHQQVIINFTFY